MWTTKSIVSLTLAAVLAMYMISTASACSCMPSHPQEQYCNADFGKFFFYNIGIIWYTRQWLPKFLCLASSNVRFFLFFIFTVIVARILSRRAVQNQRFVYKIDIRKEYKVKLPFYHPYTLYVTWERINDPNEDQNLFTLK